MSQSKNIFPRIHMVDGAVRSDKSLRHSIDSTHSENSSPTKLPAIARSNSNNSVSSDPGKKVSTKRMTKTPSCPLLTESPLETSTDESELSSPEPAPPVRSRKFKLPKIGPKKIVDSSQRSISLELSWPRNSSNLHADAVESKSDQPTRCNSLPQNQQQPFLLPLQFNGTGNSHGGTGGHHGTSSPSSPGVHVAGKSKKDKTKIKEELDGKYHIELISQALTINANSTETR